MRFFLFLGGLGGATKNSKAKYKFNRKTMQSISSFISPNKGVEVEIKKEKIENSERAEAIKQIYSLYISDQERLFRKNENWKRFAINCKSQRLPFKEPTVIEAFKKSKLFIKEYDVKTFAIRLAHIPTKDLYYIHSICRDKHNRKEKVGAWLFATISPNFKYKTQ